MHDDHDPPPLVDRIPGETAVRRSNFVTSVRGAAADVRLNLRIAELSERLAQREDAGISLCDPGERFQLAED